MLCEKTELSEVLDFVAKRVGKRLQERAAAGGARFVEEYVVYCPAAYLEALHVLPAYVYDKVDVRAEKLRGCKVRDSFNYAAVYAESVFKELLAVPRNG